jgi:hypothetical protein
MNFALRIALYTLLLVAVFDPSDQITHWKVPLFVLVWFLVGLDLLFSGHGIHSISPNLMKYVFLFSVVFPLVSIMLYIVRKGLADPYDGFQYLKSYLFLTLVFVIALKKVNLMPALSFILTGLSLAAIIISVLTYDNPTLTSYIWMIGDTYGFVAPGARSYADLSYSYVYFFTSPLLVLSLAYFTYRAIKSQTRASRYIFIVLLFVNILGMLDSGPRNNLVFGIVTPLLVLIWYTGKKWRLGLLLLVFVAGLVVTSYGSEIFTAMLDPGNESNAVKLAHLQDYRELFSDPAILLFGQGLGSYFFATGFGYTTSITELTYLEFIRNFGLPVAVIYFGMLLYPLVKLRDKAFAGVHYLLLAYGCYLLICLSNPLLLSSSGMLILAIVLYTVFPSGASAPIRMRNAFAPRVVA